MILGSACSRFRGDDVREPGDGDFDALHLEGASLAPDFIELESFHHHGEIDLKLSARGSHQRAPGYDPLRKKSVQRTPQRFVTEPEVEADCLTGPPSSEHVGRVKGEKQIPILGRKKEPRGACIVIGPRDTDQNETSL
jgi:hypothetical protein